MSLQRIMLLHPLVFAFTLLSNVNAMLSAADYMAVFGRLFLWHVTKLSGNNLRQKFAAKIPRYYYELVRSNLQVMWSNVHTVR